MKKFKVEMIIETADILDDHSADDHAYELHDMIDRETYKQIKVQSIMVKEES